MYQAEERTAMASSATLIAEGSGKQQQSPRNTGGQAVVNPTAVKLGTIEVPKALQDGEKFLKWDEILSSGGNLPDRLLLEIRVDSLHGEKLQK